ncbi:hypothetical protein ACIBBD_26115 [Streptomyces sp. NPDC051315]|uniref:hypothetical protein n=1 Tax=Streptomyces sp. NPDC051315 TaxID=3365650 RepID=UPI0037A77393
MIGDRVYDAVGVGPLITRGDPEPVVRLAMPHGPLLDPDVLLASTLLHVYSDPLVSA